MFGPNKPDAEIINTQTWTEKHKLCVMIYVTIIYNTYIDVYLI